MVFDYLDKDRDGTISYNEFCEFQEEKRRNNVVQNQQVIDHAKDINDRMHLSKIMVFLCGRFESKFNTLNKAFKFFDIDRDREITKQEFVQGIVKLKINLQKNDCDIIFDHLDRDRDGTICLEEFLALSGESRTPNPTSGAQPLQLNSQTLKLLNHPFKNPAEESNEPSNLKFEDLES